jgi:1-acylglycerone phosphate reductase
VFATARNLAKVQHLKDLDIEVIQVDVIDGVSIKQAVEAVRAKNGGKLDILVNNSGGGVFDVQIVQNSCNS